MIDDATVQLLKIEVERLVRPIRAMRWRKDRMREELWSHLVGRADTFFDDEPDHDWAVRQSLALLGDREALTEELQSSVPALEQLLWTPLFETRWLEAPGRRLWGLADPESPWRTRPAIGWSALTLGLALFINPLVNWAFDRPLELEKFMLFSGSFCVLALATHAVLIPFASEAYRRWLGDAKTEPAARLALRGALLAGVMLASGAAFAWLTHDYFEFDVRDGALWSVLSLAAPMIWALLMRHAADDRRHWREWESLIAEE